MPRQERGQPEHQQPDILARLEQAVGEIHDSDSFRRYLDVQARFHRYSFGNTLLILMQRPDATQVAGFKAWSKLNRFVKRGEKGIGIVVPHVRKVATADESNEEGVGGQRRITGFGIGRVFDITQTDGEPLPTVEVPVLEGEEGRELYDRLTGLTVREGLSLERRPAEVMQQDVMGYYSPTERVIVVREAAPLQMAKTLAHELGHHFAGHQDTREESETVAESIAYVVAAHHGLDTGARSFPYVATWSRDPAVFRQVLGTVQRVSAQIIDGLAEVELPESPVLPSATPAVILYQAPEVQAPEPTPSTSPQPPDVLQPRLF